jgi:hypothetical protein
MLASEQATFATTVTAPGAGLKDATNGAANGGRFGPPEEWAPGADGKAGAGIDSGKEGRDLDGSQDQGPEEEDYIPRGSPFEGTFGGQHQPCKGAAAEGQGGAGTAGARPSWLRGLFSPEGAREAAPTLVAGGSGAPAGKAAGSRVPAPQTRYWVASVMKLLITHLQLLGLLRGLRVNWPEAVNGALIFFDQTSTVSSWVSLDCSLSDSDSGGLRRSVKRTVLLLMLPGEWGEAARCGAAWPRWIGVARLRWAAG